MPRKQPQSHEPGYDTRASAFEAHENARTIEQIPSEQLPWPDVRDALIARALAGYDTYAYHPVLSTTYVIWDRQPHAWQESRFTPRAWAVAHGFPVDTPPDGSDAA